MLPAGPKLGWRWPFVLVAAPSMLVSLAMLLTVPEPQRGVTEPALQVPCSLYSEQKEVHPCCSLLL